MTLDEKLKEIKANNAAFKHYYIAQHGQIAYSESAGPVIEQLLLAIDRCREQRKENALGWEQFDYEFEAHWSEEKDDLELLRLVEEGE